MMVFDDPYPGKRLAQFTASLLRRSDHELLDSILVRAPDAEEARAVGFRDFWMKHGNLKKLDAYVRVKFLCWIPQTAQPHGGRP
jgi:hypothetical protein